MFGELYRALRDRQLPAHSRFIASHEADVAGLFIRKVEFDPRKIKPELVICETRADYAVYRYARLLQNVPTSSGVGRQIAALVYDTGQPRRVLMGVLGLTSPAYAVRDRDSHIGWSPRRRDRGLRRVMQLSVCLALPPYSFLHGGKLLALLSLSDPIREAFASAYSSPLLAVTTTAATGMHAPVFNRIQLPKVTPAPGQPPFTRSQAFRRAGMTLGYSTCFIRPETVELARNLASVVGLEEPNVGAIRTEWSKDRVLKFALRQCGISRTVLRLNPKAIYVGALDDSHLDNLRNPRLAPVIRSLTVEQATAWWARHEAAKVLAGSGFAAKLARYSPGGLKLSRTLRRLTEAVHEPA